MRKRFFITAFSVVTAMALLVGCGNADKKDEKKAVTPSAKRQVYFATGTPGGVYQILGAGMAKVVNDKNIGIEMVATTPAQIAQAPTMIQSGNAAYAIGMACMFERAFNAEEEFKDKPHKKLTQVLAMYDNSQSYLALKNSPFNLVTDIVGKPFAATATNVILIKAVLSAGGVDPSNLPIKVMSYQQSAEALGDGVVASTTLTGFPKNGTLDSLATTKGVKLLNMTAEHRAAFDKKHPLWKTTFVPKGTYTGVDYDAWGPTIYTVMYTSSDASEADVYNVTKAIIENSAEIAKVHPAGKDMVLETTKRYIKDGLMKVDRMHPGAVKYFKEKGVIN